MTLGDQLREITHWAKKLLFSARLESIIEEREVGKKGKHYWRVFPPNLSEKGVINASGLFLGLTFVDSPTFEQLSPYWLLS